MTRSLSCLCLAPALWAALAGVRTAAADAAPSTGQAVDEEAPPARAAVVDEEAPIARAAVAKPPPEEIEAPGSPRHTAIYFDFGFGTPLGIVGFEGVHRFGQWLEVSIGVGNGLTAEAAQPNGRFGHALQWSVMPRLRVAGDRHVLTLGAGLSGGEFSSQVLCFGCDDEAGPNTTYPTSYTLWANFEIGGELWTRSGFAFRYFLGLAHEMTLAPSASSDLDIPIPYLGLGLGYAF